MDLENALKNFPFLSVIEVSEDNQIRKYIGIILNQTKKYTGVYILDPSMDKEEREEFLGLGKVWWEESNRKLPISLFIKHDFDKYRKYMVNFENRYVENIQGPITSLSNITKKRIKRITIKINNII